MLRSIASTRRSYFTYSANRKLLVRLLSLRYNHHHARFTDTVTPSTSSGEFLHTSPDFIPTWSANRPLTEMLSLDDFGSVSTLKTAPKHDQTVGKPIRLFLDELLRPVPTAESLELGGSLELNEVEREDLEVALSDGCDISALIGGLENTTVTEKATPSPLTALGVAGATVTAAVAAAVAVAPVISTHIVPEDPSGPPSVDELLTAVDNENMETFRASIAGRPWPEGMDFGSRLHDVLSFVAKKSNNSEEAIGLLEGFFTTNPRSFLPEDVVLPLFAKACEERGVVAAKEMISRSRKAFTIRPPRTRRTTSLLYQTLFSIAIQNAGLPGVLSLITSLSENKFLEDTNITARILANSIFARETSIETNLHDWKTASQSFGSTVGIDVAFEALFREDQGNTKDLEAILKHSKVYAHPFATLAEMICSLVRLRKVEEAKLVFSKVFVTGRYFRSPLRRFVFDEDLESVEKLAFLVTDCMFAEKRRWGGSKMKKSTDNDSLLALGEAIDRFTGTARRQRQVKPVYEEKKRKRHRLNEEELHELSGSIRDAWAKLSTENEESTGRLRAWCERNGVVYDQKKKTSSGR